MGLFGWLGGAAHSIRGAVGSFGNDVDNTIGNTSNWGDSINTPYRIATTPAVSVEGGTWGAHFGGRFSAPVGDAYGHILGDTFMAKTKPVNKNITKHSRATANNSAYHLDFKASESKHNSTHHKKKKN